MTLRFTMLSLLLPFLVFGKKNVGSAERNLQPQPFSFVENIGQITDESNNQRHDIDFKLQGEGMAVYIGNGQIHYQWNKTVVPKAFSNTHQLDSWNIKQETYRLDIHLIGANTNAELIPENKQEYYENYIMPDFSKGVIAYTYNKIIYRNIYPNIDWVLYTSSTQGGNGMKYDFIVHPGGNPADIKLQYDGVTTAELLNGELRVTTPMGSLIEASPYTYKASTGEQIASEYVFRDNVLSFNLPLQNETIVIDPVLNWGTYYTNPAATTGTGLVSDASGNVYFAGYTVANNIASSGAFQTTYKGNTDGFIVKFNKNGSKVWATYYGSQYNDVISGMSTDLNGSLYVAGETMDTTHIFATTGCHQDSNGGNGLNGQTLIDCFLAKFNTNGQRQWSTYYGGYFNEYINAITCDDSGYVYIGGYTESPTNISTPGSFRPNFGGSVLGSSNEGFFVKFNPAGVREWGTYYAGKISALAIDHSFNVYVGGTVAGITVGIVTLGCHQVNYGGGGTDGFFAKFAKWGTLRYWGSYYGGNKDDNVNAIAIDSFNNFYLGGSSISTNNIATPGAYQDTLAIPKPPNPLINHDAILVKFDSTGIRKWGTYYGDSILEAFTDLELSTDGYIYAGGYGTALGGGNAPIDALIIKFNDTGGFLWRQYYGGNLGEAGTNISLCYSKLYLGGITGSSNGIGTPGAWQSAYTSSPDILGYIAQFERDTNLFLNKRFYDSTLCIGGTYNMAYHTTNRYGPNNTFTVQMSDVNGSFANPLNIGTKSFDSSGYITYTIPANTAPATGYRLRVISSSPADTTADNGFGIRMSLAPKLGPVATLPVCEGRSLQLDDTATSPTGTTHTWTGPGNFNASTKNATRLNMQLADSGDYVIAANHQGCIIKDTLTISVRPKPAKPTIQNNSPVCVGDTLKLIASTTTPGVTTYAWANYHNGTSVWYVPVMDADTIIASAKLADSGAYRINSLLNGCPSDTTLEKVIIQSVVTPTLQISASPGVNVGPFVSIDFSIASSTGGGASPSYQWTKNGIDIPGATGTTYQATTQSNLQTGDKICLNMTSSFNCAQPATVISCLEMTIDLGVDNVTSGNSIVSLFPNPTTGKVFVKCKTPGILYISNIHGQDVARYEVNKTNSIIELPESIALGVYIGRYVTENSSVFIHRIVLKK